VAGLATGERAPEDEGVASADNLEEPERRLWDAYARGDWVDLRTGDAAANDLTGAMAWDAGRVVRAQVIRALLLGARDGERGAAPAVRLRGARITGRLDLMGATVGCPLVCEYCYFDDEPRFVEATTKTIRIVRSALPGLNGTRMRLDGILNLEGCQVGGLLRLDQVKITGQLAVRAATIRPAGSTAAMSADGLTVDGSVDAISLAAHGSVSMREASISGSLDLSSARVDCPGQRALMLSNTVIGGKLDGAGLTVSGEMLMQNTRVAGSLILAAARLDNPDGVALSAGGLISGGMFLTEGFVALGGIRLIGAQLDANLTMAGATLSKRDGLALDLIRARMDNLEAAGVACTGQVALTGTRVAGDVDLSGARLDTGDGRAALVAEGAAIDGSLLLAGVHARGELNLRMVGVGRRVLLTGARLQNPGGIAARLSRARVGTDVFADEMVADGALRVPGAVIGGELSLRQSRLRNPGGDALQAASLDAAGLSLLTAQAVEGAVDLHYASIGVLRDDPDRWPEQLSLEGMTYQALEPRLPARQRLRWLARDPRGHQPQPYEQLAAHYNAMGESAQALSVLYARERSQRRALRGPARAWNTVQDVAVGYGYQPWRALVWLAVLLGAGTVTFALAPPPALQAGSAPHFNAFVYTLDLLLPVVDLGQKHAFNPGGAEQWLSYLLIAAGWILVTTVAAGAARVLSRR
jgi:hypothetical protein